METFTKGDIVEHEFLELQKIIVGASKDRYLCVHPDDIGPEGRVKSHARVAMHRGAHLKKVGFREGVVGVNMHDLYKQESFARRTMMTRVLRQETVIQILLIVAAVCVVFAVLTGIDVTRRGIDRYFNKQVDRVKKEIYQKYRQEYEKLRYEKGTYSGR